MPPPKRMTANPVRPSRHRAGKPAGAASSSESEGSDADEEETKPEAPKRRTIAPPPRVSGPGKVISTGAADGSRPPVIDDAARRKAAAKKVAEVERKAREDGFVTESEEEESDEDEDDEDEESSDEESSSEEETRRPVMVRPKFISKAKRDAQQAEQQQQAGSKKPEEEQVDEEAQRRADADALVEAQIQKDLAARAAGKKHWDDADAGSGSEVDTADDVDPEAEYAAWRLREIKRIVRARKVIEAKEKELAEKERRQNLTEEERRAEDEALLAKQREEKEGRGKMGYMQKYFHKGAFYQDESAAQGLDKRDIMGARFADDVRNRELLPQALQMRDMTKLGKKGASKYKDLKSEDTGSWGRFDDPRRQRSQWDQYGDGGDRERDRGGDYGGKGANAMPLGERKSGDGDRSGDRDRDRDNRRRDRSRSRSRSPPRRRDRSRSRSPRRRDRDDYRDSRKRDYSRERDRHDSDKRRRVDTR